MSHSQIAPQAGRLSNETVAPRSRAEILDRYRRFRAISRVHNSGALKRLSTEALLEQARRLGIARGRQLILNTEDEFPLLYDLAVYARQGGRKRPLDRYAAAQQFSPDSDEARVLDAMLAGRFALIRVERRHPKAGLILSDLMRKKEFWLVDEGLESTAPVGCKMATRVYAPEDFYMTAGASVPLDGVLLMSAIARRPLLARMNSNKALDDRRFAEAIYREAIKAGVMERIRFRDPPGLAVAAA
jgi:hypothetical protein